MKNRHVTAAHPCSRRIIRRRRRRKLRGYFFLIPAVFLLSFWVGDALRPAYRWVDLMRDLNVRDTRAFTKTATLGVLICMALIVYRILYPPRPRS